MRYKQHNESIGVDKNSIFEEVQLSKPEPMPSIQEIKLPSIHIFLLLLSELLSPNDQNKKDGKERSFYSIRLAS
jgi:hypothetical protein